MALARLAAQHQRAAAALNLLWAGTGRPAELGAQVCKEEQQARKSSRQDSSSSGKTVQAATLHSNTENVSTHVLQLHARAAELADLCNVGAALAKDRPHLCTSRERSSDAARETRQPSSQLNLSHLQDQAKYKTFC